MAREMTPDERREYEENRKELLEAALEHYHIGSRIDEETDKIILTGELDAIVNFYGDWRSEIEEVL